MPASRAATVNDVGALSAGQLFDPASSNTASAFAVGTVLNRD